MVAISEALAILNYWELPEEDQPGELIWGDDPALESWFQMIKERRRAKSRGEDYEEVPQVQNDYIKEWLSGNGK